MCGWLRSVCEVVQMTMLIGVVLLVLQVSKRVNDLIDIKMYTCTEEEQLCTRGVESPLSPICIQYTDLLRCLLAWHVLSLILLVLRIYQEHWVHCLDCSYQIPFCLI